MDRGKKSELSNLQQKTEKQLKAKQSEVSLPTSESDIRKLAHELSVHQIELEAQNEELNLANEQSEELLRMSEEKYRTLFNSLMEGYCIIEMVFDANGKPVDYRFLEINQAFEEQTGLHEAQGKLMRELAPDHEEHWFEIYGKIALTGEAAWFENEAKALNRWYEVRASRVGGQESRKVIICFNDITQRKLAEEIIKDNEKRFSELIESLPQLFWTCRVDGPCDYLSKQWVKYTGVPEAEQLGYRWLEQLHPEDKDGTVSKWMENVKTGNSFDIEFRIRRNDGIYRWFKTRAVPMHNAEGNIIKWFGSNTDIDEIKKAEEQLRKLNRIYSLLSDVNQAIVRTRNPNELFEKVCNIAVKQGGFGMAWIGLVDDLSQKLQVIAKAGRTNGYFEHIDISLTGEPLSYCPIDSVLRQGKHIICNIIKNEEMASCQKNACKLGFQTSASFPLKVSGILKGALTFYSDEPDFFDEAELKLLDELALDISFAMEYAEKETERRRVEEALLKSEVRFRIAAETSNDVVYEWDLKQEVIWFGKIDEMLGYSPGEFPRTLDGLGASVHPEDWVRVMAAVQAHLEGRAPYAEDYRVLMKDGTFRWWSARGAVARMPDGKPVRWIGTVTDITERKQVDQELREREARYKTLVENIPQKILMKDINYRWISINENLARDFGISPEEIVGKLDRDLFSKELADKYHADDVRIITNGKTEELEEKYIVDGKETWVNTIKTPVRDNKGEIIGVLGILWDITGRKLAEEEIHKLNTELEGRVVMRTAQLEASNKELEAFSYSVSHDLRAPLRHVSGYVELLNKHFQSDLSEKGLHYLNSIGDSVHIMGMLIDDLLQFSRTGRMEMHQSDLDMNEIVKEVKESLCKDNPDRKIEWVIEELPSVNGDGAMLKLVWTNLLGNAVKFSRKRQKARIEIGVRKENKELVFFVRDNGVGFDMQYAHKLFGVFQRLHSTEEFEGTGIGLANVQRIVLRQGGRTWAEAEPDKGAVFYFSIPNK
jgi:PAS domain S-box-containing protein